MKQITISIYFTIVLLLLVVSGCGSGKNSVETSDSDVSEVIYNIGHESISFQDSQQNSYAITAELFYPCEIGADQSAIADDDFPLIVFAHGYQQVYNDYRYLWEALVPKGYILAFLTTQQGLSINIDTYADDIISLHNELRNSSHYVMAGHITKKSALMGHSTGGGAIYLAQEKSPQSTTLISLAALGEPYGPIVGSSPINGTGNITVPTLILSGDKDCITPAEIHQKPLYNALTEDKTMVTIKGGDHCGFSDSGNCPAAESLACGLFFQGITISEIQQRSLTLQLLTPWLDHFLKDKPDAWSLLLSLEDNNTLLFKQSHPFNSVN